MKWTRLRVCRLSKHLLIVVWASVAGLPVLAQEQAPPAPPVIFVIHAGGLLRDPGETPLREQTVVVTDGKITAVEEGYEADLIAVGGDPVQDVSRLRTVSFVMKAGAVVRTTADTSGAR